MVFEFQCPQGHVLSGNESDVGQMSQCPICGDSFLIPNPLEPPAGFIEPTVQDQTPIVTDDEPTVEVEDRLNIRVTDQAEQPGTDVDDPAVALEAELLHIDCPNGHQLEVPREMLDTDALCPHCDVQFRLREVDSEEHQHKKEVEAETRERKMANAWLNWTIALGIIVVLFFLTIWILTILSKEETPASESTVTKDFLSRVFATGTHHAASWMTGSTTKIKAAQWRAVIGPARYRTHEVELIEAHRPLHDVATGQTKRPFQIERAEYLAVFNGSRQIGSITGQQFNAPIGKVFLDVIPMTTG